MRTIALLLAVHIFSALFWAQAGDPDLATLKKTIKKELEKSSSSVTGVELKECVLTIKLARGDWMSVMPQPKSIDVKPDYAALRPEQSTTRPGEEAARHHSSGTDEDFPRIETDKFMIDLSGAEFIAGSGKGRDGLIQVAFAATNKDQITRKVDGKVVSYPGLSFGIKSASFDQVGVVMRQVQSLCTQPK